MDAPASHSLCSRRSATLRPCFGGTATAIEFLSLFRVPSARPSMRAVTILAVLPLIVGGCAFSLRAGASPTVDTRGRLGAQVYLGGSFGLAGEENRYALSYAVEGQARVAQREPATVAYAVGADFQSLTPLAWRAGVRLGLGTSPDELGSFGMAGVAVAVLPTIDSYRRRYRGLGAELRMLWLGGKEWNDVVELSLGAVYEAHMPFSLKVIP